MNTCRVGIRCTLLTIMQILDRLSVIGFFWWHQYQISVHAKNPYWYTSSMCSTVVSESKVVHILSADNYSTCSKFVNLYN